MDGPIVFPRLRQCAPDLIMLTWGHLNQHPIQHLDTFSHFCTAYGRELLYFTMGRHSRPKIAAYHGAMWTHLIRDTQFLNRNSMSIGSAVFAGLISVTDRQTDRQTDHATRSVTIGRIYICSTVMRPKSPNNKNVFSVTLLTILVCYKLTYCSCDRRLKNTWGSFLSQILQLASGSNMVSSLKWCNYLTNCILHVEISICLSSYC